MTGRSYVEKVIFDGAVDDNLRPLQGEVVRGWSRKWRWREQLAFGALYSIRTGRLVAARWFQGGELREVSLAPDGTVLQQIRLPRGSGAVRKAPPWWDDLRPPFPDTAPAWMLNDEQWARTPHAVLK